ncbi:MAG: hypothetical protein QF645_07200 [Planctomycetota bacterium]|jgi:hypothetical protein|nr:hypothetical protein [Planctomycetota bacterium]
MSEEVRVRVRVIPEHRIETIQELYRKIDLLRQEPVEDNDRREAELLSLENRLGTAIARQEASWTEPD